MKFADVEFFLPLDDSRQLEHSLNQMTMESLSCGGIKDPLIVGQPILAITQELWVTLMDELSLVEISCWPITCSDNMSN